MSNEAIIKKTSDFVKTKLSGVESSHDWWHILRVWNNAKNIGKTEKANMLIVELAALLHDISDWKFNGGNEQTGAKVAEGWLNTLRIEKETIHQVIEIIGSSSFKGANVPTSMSTIEGKIVQDADRLDAIGAVGIGRTFAFGGHMGREMYNPNIQPELHETEIAYKNALKNPTLNHFHEKLLLLKDRMNTQTAKKIAQERHAFMVEFLDRFLQEWDGKK